MRTQRFNPDKNKSQIVFDITGGEKHYTTMNLNTIPKDPPIIRSRNENFSLRTDDIDGAQWKPDKRPTHNYTLNISDIEGSSPKPSFNKLKPPFDIMSVDDIDGAKPYIPRNLPHSNRHTDPQNPVYQLSQKPEEPYPVTKFIYDGFSNDDIPGSHPKTYKTSKPPKDIMKTSDIYGARPRRYDEKFDPQNRILDVTDINDDGLFHTRRHLNPLNPEYKFDGQTLKADYGRPHTNYKTRTTGETDYSLKTSDIEGAHADSQTQWYRTFKYTPVQDDEPTEESTSVMLPSMKKQTAELQRQRAIYKMRGERIQRFESRHLRHDTSHCDHLQAVLRNQRSQSAKRPRTNMRPNKIVL